MQKKEVLKTIKIFQNISKRNFKDTALKKFDQISKMQNLSQDKLEQISRMNSLPRNKLEQIAKKREVLKNI